jgi:two-component system, cell cycle sensor histidine kinase and response regulator CckA
MESREMPSTTVLVVEDDEGLNKSVRKLLNREGLATEGYASGSELLALDLAGRKDILLLLDYSLPDMTARHVIEALRQRRLDIPFIIVTGHGDEELAVEMMKLGALDYVVKTFEFHELLPVKVVHACREISAKKRLVAAEQAVRQAAEEWQKTFDSISDAILILDIEQRITHCNAAALKLLGKPASDIIGRHCCGLLHGAKTPVPACPVTSLKRSRAREYGELLMGDRSFSITADPIVDGHDSLVGAVHVMSDITERKRAEEEKSRLEDQLLQAQKMEAIGRLAGGVAHDFNNLLAAISGYTSLAMMKIEETDPLYRDLKQVSNAAARAAGVVRQLLLFSRKQPMEPVPIDLNGTVRSLVKMIERLIGEDVRIEIEAADDLWPINGDEGNIEQVLMNLAVNARDAMPEGGTLAIRTGNAVVDDAYCAAVKAGRPGDFVCMSVTDAGTGMDKETIAHIFEPFFTTKEAGKGTGLGLSVVFGIVQQHKGWIEVKSEPGKGSSFMVYLPRSSFEVERKDAATVPTSTLRGNGERVLLVEDHEEVRFLAEEILSTNGYRVFAAASAREATSLFEKENGAFDLVFSDVVLPDKSGVLLVEELLTRGAPRVLFASGYTDEKANWDYIKSKNFRFLRKPYSIPELLGAVRETLHEKTH